MISYAAEVEPDSPSEAHRMTGFSGTELCMRQYRATSCLLVCSCIFLIPAWSLAECSAGPQGHARGLAEDNSTGKSDPVLLNTACINQDILTTVRTTRAATTATSGPTC